MADKRDIAAIIALPLRIVETTGGYRIEDAKNRVLAYHKARHEEFVPAPSLTWPEAEAIAKAVACALTKRVSPGG